MSNNSLNWLRAVLFLAGAFTVFTGLNIALGGIATLGWQGPSEYFRITDARGFLAHDSHTRFLGGVWLGVGALLLAAPINPRRFRHQLEFAFALIFLGGLARLGQMSPETTFGPDVVSSLIAELIGMPVLFAWLRVATREERP